MRIALTVPNDLVSPVTLGAALEAATRLGTVELSKGKAPPLREAIARGVRWRREPPGQESFDPPSVVWGRRWGDCDDLAPWRAAELRVTGEDPRAKAIALRSGPGTWHAIVQRSNGTREDPSLWAGMPGRQGQGAAVAQPLRGVGHGAVVIGEGFARIDVPGRHARNGCPMGYAVISRLPNRDAAIREVLTGAVRVGMCSGLAEPRALALLRALYRFVCQSQDIRDALRIEGLPQALARSPLAVSLRREHEVGFACLAAIPAIAAGVAAAVGAVTPIVKAIIDAVQATAKAVEQGVKPIEDLYKQVRSGLDQGTLPLETALKTADELQAHGFTPEAERLRRESQEADDARKKRNMIVAQVINAALFHLPLPEGYANVASAEDLMKLARTDLGAATNAAALGDLATANAKRDGVRNMVQNATWLPDPGPLAVWESLAHAFGLDPQTARPMAPPQAGAKAARVSRGPQAVPRAPGPAPQSPADDGGGFLPPGIDALFARAGAFM